MARKYVVFAGFMLLAVALLLTIPGSAQIRSLADIACQDFDPLAAAAASDVQSVIWKATDPFQRVPSSVLFAANGVHPCGNPEGRRMGLELQVDRILRSGDVNPGGLGALTARTAQAYADSIANPTPNLTPERAYIRALALIVQIRNGFTTVPGGAAEAFNRIQTCLNGKIVTNQGNRVEGVAINCGSRAIRLAVADSIATGFYIGFRTLPVLRDSLTCDALLAQAENGATVESRWAAGKAYVFRSDCTPKTVAALSAVASNGGSAELRLAAVHDLADLLAKSRTGLSTLLAAADDSTELALANAWAAGLRIEKEVKADPADCDPVTNTLGDLAAYSLANAFLDSHAGVAAIASWARYFASESGNTKDRGTNVCVIDRNTGPLQLVIAVPGSLPLITYVTTLPE